MQELRIPLKRALTLLGLARAAASQLPDSTSLATTLVAAFPSVGSDDLLGRISAPVLETG